MADITSLPVMTAGDAASIGFATYGPVPTLPIDIPDGGFTVSMKTSQGKRLTIFFGIYDPDGTPQYADLRYHDSGATVPDARGEPTPAFDCFTISQGGRQLFDSRQLRDADKPSQLVILMEDPTCTA